MTRLIDRLRREESGFTLIEMLVACSLGTVILLATFMMLDSSVVLTGKVTDRVDRTQRARLAMSTITRELRSQVCPNTGLNAIIEGQNYSVKFYAFLGTGSFVPDQYQILWDTNTNSIVEKKWKGSLTGTTLSWAATPTQRTLVTDVKPPPSNAPVFAYYATGATSPFSAPLSDPNRKDTSKITVSFLTYAQNKTATGNPITLQSEVFARTADPSGVTGTTAPQCA